MANTYTLGVGEFDDSIPTIIAAQALGYLKANTVMSRLVARDWDNEVATKGQSVKIPYGGTLSANDKADDSQVTLQVVEDSAYTVTLNKHKELTFIIEDIARAFASPDWLMQYMQDGLAVLAEQIDSDLTALYSGFSQSIDASSGLGEDDFRGARRLLNTAKAPLGNRYAVLHEDAEYEALGIERIVNRDYAESLGSMAADSFVNRFAGFDIFLDQKIAVSTTIKNLFFHRNAMVLATRPLPNDAARFGGAIQVTMDEDGIGLRVTMSYDTNYLGPKITIDVLYGVAELRDNHGVVVLTADL